MGRFKEKNQNTEPRIAYGTDTESNRSALKSHLPLGSFIGWYSCKVLNVLVINNPLP